MGAKEWILIRLLIEMAVIIGIVVFIVLYAEKKFSKVGGETWISLGSRRNVHHIDFAVFRVLP